MPKVKTITKLLNILVTCQWFWILEMLQTSQEIHGWILWLPWEWQVPKAEDGKGVSVRVVAGTALGISSPVRTITPTYYLGIVTMMAFTVPLTSVLPPVPSLPLGYGETTIIAFFLDFRITPGGKHVQDIPDGWTAFVYTLQVPVTFLISQDLQIWTLSTCPISYLYLFYG